MITELRLLILGLLAREPRSAYALGRAFSEMPAGNYSGSPGAIYPAVSAMQREGLVQHAPSSEAATRGQRYALTAKGRRVLKKWLVSPTDEWDLLRSPSTVLLKLSFMESAPARATFRREVGALAAGTLSSLRTYRDRAQPDLSGGSDDALGLTASILKAYLDWAKEDDDPTAGAV
jgi:DNA-binding PadR family transcriptional regulator